MTIDLLERSILFLLMFLGPCSWVFLSWWRFFQCHLIFCRYLGQWVWGSHLSRPWYFLVWGLCRVMIFNAGTLGCVQVVLYRRCIVMNLISLLIWWHRKVRCHWWIRWENRYNVHLYRIWWIPWWMVRRLMRGLIFS